VSEQNEEVSLMFVLNAEGMEKRNHVGQGCQMVPNLANIAKNHCFPKNVPIFGQYFLMPKICHF